MNREQRPERIVILKIKHAKVMSHVTSVKTNIIPGKDTHANVSSDTLHRVWILQLALNVIDLGFLN